MQLVQFATSFALTVIFKYLVSVNKYKFEKTSQQTT